ncbi:29659_t:CDS:2, partial [Racocetra persica]
SMGKGLSLLEAIEQVLANTEEEKRASITKNLYHFINKEKHAEHEFMGLTPEPYLYEIPEPGECFEYIVVENDSSQKSFLNMLGKQEESIYLKLTTLFTEIPQDDMGCKEEMYKLATKT